MRYESTYERWRRRADRVDRFWRVVAFLITLTAAVVVVTLVIAVIALAIVVLG